MFNDFLEEIFAPAFKNFVFEAIFNELFHNLYEMNYTLLKCS